MSNQEKPETKKRRPIRQVLKETFSREKREQLFSEPSVLLIILFLGLSVLAAIFSGVDATDPETYTVVVESPAEEEAETETEEAPEEETAPEGETAEE